MRFARYFKGHGRARDPPDSCERFSVTASCWSFPFASFFSPVCMCVCVFFSQNQSAVCRPTGRACQRTESILRTKCKSPSNAERDEHFVSVESLVYNISLPLSLLHLPFSLLSLSRVFRYSTTVQCVRVATPMRPIDFHEHVNHGV